ncbi:hypothetical protein [Spongiactinospora gelatinilytica]|uniref:hypothetical protein n=1 Tax=Spongiactinospora gelatinilytica TaxID=2666298 RepID=UPI001F2ACED6|nr:hypothetical protein [Spongiactinospora gelatinilytica]
MRAAVRGYQDIDLDAELASVRAVLDVAGIRCAVDARTADSERISTEGGSLSAGATGTGEYLLRAAMPT